MEAKARTTPPTLEEVRSWGATTDVPSAGACFGIGRNKSYELVKAGEFPVRVLTIGTNYRVLVSELLAALDPASSASSAA